MAIPWYALISYRLIESVCEALKNDKDWLHRN